MHVYRVLQAPSSLTLEVTQQPARQFERVQLARVVLGTAEHQVERVGRAHRAPTNLAPVVLPVSARLSERAL